MANSWCSSRADTGGYRLEFSCMTGPPMNTKTDFGQSDHGQATGQVQRLLRVEALSVFAASTALFFLLGGELWIFALLFFAPDLSLVGYVAGRKVGAVLYNAVHSYILHAALGVAGVLTGNAMLWQVALIFVAHAAFDRSLGFGLKYAAGFRHTHLGSIGRPGRDEARDAVRNAGKRDHRLDPQQ
ncbi:DUF4260 domain-containing protein [Chelativorans sp. ZYF759]|uniref:DUF4260 domain-containing protein n=1 Tax=Chelativorans sp. ZYF759 TaxID=2692213 RepID=UPI001FF02E0B|nr:DUF4260 domain-containing protein [Chelativorans sp. ZYF759]